MNFIERLERAEIKKKHPAFDPGDTIRVHLRVFEGNKERIQVFEGTVIARDHGGQRETITVRKISSGVGVEKVLPVNAPLVKKIQVVKKNKVRRAKLYFLRDVFGKKARLVERSGAEGIGAETELTEEEKAQEKAIQERIAEAARAAQTQKKLNPLKASKRAAAGKK
jgi:large subunit ribosomal protein L19